MITSGNVGAILHKSLSDSQGELFICGGLAVHTLSVHLALFRFYFPIS